MSCNACHDPADRRRRSPFVAERDQPGRQLHRPQRADGDQRGLLAAVAVLGRARRFALEPGAVAAGRRQPSATAAGSPSRTCSTINYRADYDGGVRRGPAARRRWTTDALPVARKAGRGGVRRSADADKATRQRIYANFGKAIAAYERRLVSTAFKPSPFDAFMAGDADAMSPAAIRGARLFVGRAGCAECHRGAMFTDFSFHNIGVPQTGEYARDRRRPLRRHRPADANVVSNIFTRAGDFSDDTDDTSTSTCMRDRRRRENAPKGSSRRRRCATSARPRPTCTTAPTRRCGTS